jgi:hypothetical protein
MLKKSSPLGKGIDMRGLELIGSVATQVSDTQIIGKDEDDIRLLGGDLFIQRLICGL